MTSPIKSSALDLVPMFLLREFVDLLLPYVTHIINSSLRDARVPNSHKHADITPLLKQPGLDTMDMANSRPVSNATFVSKVIEHTVAKQLHQYLTDNELLPRYQSAYRRHHSTETAMLRILSDALTAADENQVTSLSLLDLSAAFDCIDHQLMLQRLRTTSTLVTQLLAEWCHLLQAGVSRLHAKASCLSTYYVPPNISQLFSVLTLLLKGPWPWSNSFVKFM